ncbi:exported hypothetical protein [Cupriavidus taiwanensis]|uniref:Uncharacterized protein n=1 Tax=Cupriavidus taiwanensis TaxID=164546 RepID=A0A976A800_9BURK|nr:exported hypothetical protein [Cupriavidus taiwanensis]
MLQRISAAAAGPSAVPALAMAGAERPLHHLSLPSSLAWHRGGHASMSLPPNFANNALRVIAGRTESHHARESRCHPHCRPARARRKRQDLARRGTVA